MKIEQRKRYYIIKVLLLTAISCILSRSSIGLLVGLYIFTTDFVCMYAHKKDIDFFKPLFIAITACIGGIMFVPAVAVFQVFAVAKASEAMGRLKYSDCEGISKAKRRMKILLFQLVIIVCSFPCFIINNGTTDNVFNIIFYAVIYILIIKPVYKHISKSGKNISKSMLISSGIYVISLLFLVEMDIFFEISVQLIKLVICAFILTKIEIIFKKAAWCNDDLTYSHINNVNLRRMYILMLTLITVMIGIRDSIVGSFPLLILWQLIALLMLVIVISVVSDVIRRKHPEKYLKKLLIQKGIANQLIVTADIRSLSYMGEWLGKARIRSYPRLKTLMVSDAQQTYSYRVVDYEKYLEEKRGYESMRKKSFIIYGDNFKVFADSTADRLSAIIDKYFNEGFNVFLLINSLGDKRTKAIYESVAEKTKGKLNLITGEDIPAEMSFPEYLCKFRTCENDAEYGPEMQDNKTQLNTESDIAKAQNIADNTVNNGGIDNDSAVPEAELETVKVNSLQQEQYNIPGSSMPEKNEQPAIYNIPTNQNMASVQTQYFGKISSKISTIRQLIYYALALITRIPWSDFLINVLFVKLSKKHNSWLYGAIKKYYNVYQPIIFAITLALNHLVYINTAIYYSGTYYKNELISEERMISDELVTTLRFIVNPLVHLFIAAAYLGIMYLCSKHKAPVVSEQKSLIINMDISDIMNPSYYARLSFSDELKQANERETVFEKNGTLSVSYYYYRQYEDILSRIKDKTIVIHAERSCNYYNSKRKFDMFKQIEMLCGDFSRVYINTRFPETYPVTDTYMIIRGGYFESIYSIILSSDNVNQNIYALSTQYTSMLVNTLTNELNLGMSNDNNELRVLYSQLEQLKRHYSMLEIFYEYMKTAELFMHYTALLVKPVIELGEKGSFEMTVGKMEDEVMKGKSNDNVINIIPFMAGNNEAAVTEIQNELRKATEFFIKKLKIAVPAKQSKTKCCFELLTRIRNLYIGHGSLTYSVSEEFITAFIPVASVVIAECMAILKFVESCTPLVVKKMPVVTDKNSEEAVEMLMAKKMNTGLFLMNKIVKSDTVGIEYINPITGEFCRDNMSETILLNWNGENFIKREAKTDE